MGVIRNNGIKLKKIQAEGQEKKSACSVELWNGSQRYTMEALFLESFKPVLNKALKRTVDCSHLQVGGCIR